MFDKATNVVLMDQLFKNWAKYDYIRLPSSVKKSSTNSFLTIRTKLSYLEAYGDTFEIRSLDYRGIDNLILGAKTVRVSVADSHKYIKKITLLDGVVDFNPAQAAFSGCTINITFPKSINKISYYFLKGVDVYGYDFSGVTFTLEEGGDLTVRDGNIYRKSRNSLCIFYSGNAQEAINSVEGVEIGAFWGYSQQGGTIIIGDNIKFFEDTDFRGIDTFILRSKHIVFTGQVDAVNHIRWVYAKNVIIETQDIIIGSSSFSTNNSVRILGRCTLNSRAFMYYKGESIEINLVESIGDMCFAGCLSVKTLKINSTVAPTLGSGVFGSASTDYLGRNTYNTGENRFIVPAGSTGYDTGQWSDPLCNPDKCGFTLVEEV